MVYELTSKISKCRNELMGIAILEVMLWHLQESAGVRNQLLQVFTKLIYTPGFFFLSGFGLFYSLSGNSNILSFYRKRIFRLYLPYLIISTPFILYIGILKGKIIVDLLMDISTLNFWIRGNYLGVWYIAVSLVLYFIAPILYRIMFRIQDKSYLLAWLTVLGFAFFLYIPFDLPHISQGGLLVLIYFLSGCLLQHFQKRKDPLLL